MAVTVAECEQMIAAAKENHIKLMIAYRLHLDAANMEFYAELRIAVSLISESLNRRLPLRQGSQH